jgi:ferredoxin
LCGIDRREINLSLTINADLCCGHGICVDVAPALVEMRDDGKAHVIVDSVDDSLRSQAEACVAICPQMAIDFYPDGAGGPTYNGM